MKPCTIVVVATLAAAGSLHVSLLAHHSNVGFAVETVNTATGVVKEWKWMNPHTWLIVDVDDGREAPWSGRWRAVHPVSC